MKKGISRLCLTVVLAVGIIGGIANAQGVSRGPISAPRDPELEKQCSHSLDVAKYYFYKRKPDKGDKDGLERLNKAVESRLLEILDLNPNFGKVDEVYFMLGEVYLRGSNLDDAAKNYDRVIKDFPDSQFVGDAKKKLSQIESQAKVKKEG